MYKDDFNDVYALQGCSFFCKGQLYFLSVNYFCHLLTRGVAKPCQLSAPLVTANGVIYIPLKIFVYLTINNEVIC